MKDFSRKIKAATAVTLLLFTAATTSAQISTFSDSGGNLVFENSTGGTIFNITNNGGVNMQAKEIRNFFDTNDCDANEAIKEIYANGTFKCNTLSTTTQAENLSETLAAGNVANQSIDFDGNNIDNLSELNPSGGNLILGSNFTLGGEGTFARVNRITSKPVSPMYDSWDDGDVDEYQLVEDNGVGSVSASQVTSGVQEGSAATEVTFSNKPYSQPYGALVQSGSDGPERGDKFQGYIKATSSAGGPSVIFAEQPNDPGAYELDLDIQNDRLLLDTVLGTNNDGRIDNTSVNLIKNNYYRFVVDWKLNGTINAELYNVSSGNRVAQVRGTDTSYSFGRWGIFMAANSQNSVSAVYDGFNILSSEEIDVDAGVDFENNSLSEISEIRGFFNQTQCASDEAIKTIYPNGSYNCNKLSSTTQADNLSETLAAGNVANRTIRYGFNKEQGIQIGGSTTNTNNNTDIAIGRGAQADAPYNSGFGNETAIGTDAKANGTGATALGYQAQSSGQDTVALGSTSEASGNYAVALGDFSKASAKNTVALGPASSASGFGAVAIGNKAKAPNAYEATFGNLNGEELDVNVTGNLTVHGTSTVVQNLTVKGSCTGCGGGGSVENLSETMQAGNNAGANLNMKDYNITNNNGANVSIDDSLKVYGNVYTSGADLAEIYSAEGDPAPGTVVKVSDGKAEVEATEARFEDAVGVVSSNPGHVLNSNAEGVRVALEGKVPVRVAPGEEIEEGDEVASGRFGTAVACDTGSVPRVSADSSRKELAEAINSLTVNQNCLEASFGTALNSSESGWVSVKVE
ncbi:MAG: hypothetical protein ABEK16_00505 [Candidatus Nanohalobium sp.]